METFLLKGDIIPSQFVCEYLLYIGFFTSLNNYNPLYKLALTFIYYRFVVLATTIRINC